MEKLQWFVVRTQPQLERLAVSDLARRGFTAWLPTVTERRAVRPRALLSRKMRRETATSALVQVPMFRRYLFVQLDLRLDDWSKVLKADGVRDLMRHPSGRLAVVSFLDIDHARAQADAGFVPDKLIKDLAVGSKLMLTNGSFTDHEGVCLWSSETRVRLLLTLFGVVREVSAARSEVIEA